METNQLAAQARTVPELLQRRAASHGDRPALVYLVDGESQEQVWTYDQLDQTARKIAGWLRSQCEPNQRAMLVFPPGLDFIGAFFGCLYAGVTAVPAYPPRRRGNMDRLGRIAANCRAAVVLTDNELLADQASAISAERAFSSCRWESVENILNSSVAIPATSAITEDMLAFLQYTSGSTGTPKGVSVSHGNLLHNQRMLAGSFCQSFDTMITAGWLPMYHDMGLVGNLLHPIYMGGKLVFMSPFVFLQKPQRWLNMISRYRATISGGPNFAYDLCTSRVTAEELSSLDLSSWQVAFNGAEPIRYQTLRAFEQKFAAAGFRSDCFCPCYGMAETTLIVSGSKPREPWHALQVDAVSLREHRVVPVGPTLRENKDAIPLEDPSSADPQQATLTVVGCGQIGSRTTVRIVNPDTLCVADSGTMGEIWVQGPSVAQGYWEQPEATYQAFHAQIADDSSCGQFLRTGDLGFIHDGELYVAGRLKDLVIIHGANYYPQDIEQTAERSHESLSPGNGVAFSLTRNGEETLVIAQELSRASWRNYNCEEIAAAITHTVWDDHQLIPEVICLVRPGGIPKTTSGKLQRRSTKQMFEEGSLPLLATWDRAVNGVPLEAPETAEVVAAASSIPVISQLSPSQPTNSERDSPNAEPPVTITAADLAKMDSLRDWLIARIAQFTQLDAKRISTRQPLALFGLKSVQAVQLTAELGEHLGRTLAPTLAFDYPTIDALSRFLVLGETATQLPVAATPSEDPIAIIGLACRFPGSENIDEFRKTLLHGKDCIGPPPTDRWAHLTGTNLLGGYLDRIDQFDPLFFSISPREAEEMDPQQRLMLEVAWEACEHARRPLTELDQCRTGVFVGVSGNEYARLMSLSGCPASGHSATGNSLAMVANRISYLFNLQGPSLSVDTACSSSLVAVHTAIESLHRGECDLAIAGGVSLMCAPDVTEALAQAGMLSPTSYSHAFAADANGFVRGEGCGAVVLKRLSQAQRDGDTVYCVLRGSAVNQDGRSNGLTAPNGRAQQDVVLRALQRARLSPQEIDYVEAHGTGTELGDPIEMRALQSVFADRKNPLLVGSVKTNIGHLEGAAGIAGLIKVCLALGDESIPTHLHFTAPSSHIDWNGSIEVPAERVAWSRTEEHRRRAGVSSFGFGGTNAHVIVEEAPVASAQNVASAKDTDSQRLGPFPWLKLSAKSESALLDLVDAYAHWLALPATAESPIAEIIAAANTGRSDFAYRLLVAGDSVDELLQALCRFRQQLRTGQLIPVTDPLLSPSLLYGDGQTVWVESQMVSCKTATSELAKTHLHEALSFVRGAEIDWKNLHQRAPIAIRLPTYPFQRQRCWFRLPSSATAKQQANGNRESLLGKQFDFAGPTSVFENDLRFFPALADHQLHDQRIFPAAGFLDLAIVAGMRVSGRDLQVMEMHLTRPFAWSADKPAVFQTVLTPTENGFQCTISSKQDDRWDQHASCQLREPPLGFASTTAWQALGEEVSIEDHYQACEALGLHYGPAFRGVVQLNVLGDEAWGHCRLPKSVEDASAYCLHPALLDACFQTLAPLLVSERCLWLPAGIDRYQLTYARTDCSKLTELRIHGKVKNTVDSGIRTADLQLTDAQGNIVAIVQGLQLRRIATHKQPIPLFFSQVWVPKNRTKELSAPPTITAKELAAHAREHQLELCQQFDFDGYKTVRRCLDALCRDWAINALVDLAGPLGRGMPVDDADRLGIAAAQRKLWQRLLEILRQDGVLSETPAGYLVHTPLAAKPVRKLTREILGNHPRLGPELLLLARCGENLSDVLRGDVDPLNLLFSDKTPGSAADIYFSAIGSMILNRMLADAVAAIARKLPAGRSLRILEIGAGTGATTREILRQLPTRCIQYTFTDLARSFLGAASDEFAGDPRLQFERLDIEVSPESQGFSAHSFDVIVAANVLHATADLDQTLANARRLLAPGGQLLMLEGTGPVRWMDLTFGMTHGWWRFADTQLERQHPLIPPSQWQAILSRHGFCELEPISPGPDEPIETVENVLLIATADDVVSSEPQGADGDAGETSKSRLPLEQWIVCGQDQDLADALLTKLNSLGANAKRATWSKTGASLDEVPTTSMSSNYVFCLKPTRLRDLGENLAGIAEALTWQLVQLIQTILSDRAAANALNPWSFTLVQAESTPETAVLYQTACGVIRSLALEQPTCRCRMIELSEGLPHPVASLADELLSTDAELEIKLTASERLVRRLREESNCIPQSIRSVLEIEQRGSLNGLQLVTRERQELQPHEIEIYVCAAGINFRDVLNVLGRYPDEVPLGAECTGRVVRTGSEVTAFKVGDPVAAIVPSCFADYLAIPADSAVLLPQGLDLKAAATIPVAFLTAAVALETRAQLRAGQRVLIHAATGGVGLAAIQLAQAAGATVFATASLQKQAVLRRMGVPHVYDSRSRLFAEELLADTDGKGVDVVLNLLDESFVPENLQVLARGGQYIDITKPKTNLQTEISSVRPDVSYQIFDLTQLLRDDPHTLKLQLLDIFHRVEQGQLQPLPSESFPLPDAGRAFRKMQQAKHVGKLLLVPDQSRLAQNFQGQTTNSIRSDRAYAIVGGFGDIGLITAETLFRQGAGLIGLIGRNPPTVAQQLRIDTLKQQGANLVSLCADASNEGELAHALDSIRQTMPLAGVIHSAGTLSDALLTEQSEESIGRVFAAKVHGVWNLHRLTQGDALEHFMVYSSLAAVLGAPGQANHAAANAFMDALMQVRIDNGQPATAVNWGPWSDIGEAARRNVQARSDLKGLGMLSPQEGRKVVSRLTRSRQLAITVSPIDASQFSSRLQGLPLLEGLVGQPKKSAQLDSESFLNRILAAPGDSRSALMLDFVVTRLRIVLGIEGTEKIAGDQALVNLGVDSLTGIEFCDLIGRELGQRFPASVLYDYPTVFSLSDYLLTVISVESGGPGKQGSLGSVLLENEMGEIGKLSDLDKGERNQPASQGSSPPGGPNVTDNVDLEDGLSQLLTELEHWKT